MDAFEREIDILDKELENGNISNEEYNKDVRELEREMRDIYGEEMARREDFERRYGY